MKKFYLIIVLSLFTLSCRQTEKANEKVKEAMDVYFEESGENHLERSLVLINEALELDDRNFPAYTHKTTLLFEMKDLPGLFEVNSRMMELYPDRPAYVFGRGLYHELAGDTTQAKAYYRQALSAYEALVSRDTTNFELTLEYISVLEALGDTSLANIKLRKLELYNTHPDRVVIVQAYRRKPWKEEVVRAWNGQRETPTPTFILPKAGIDQTSADSVALWFIHAYKKFCDSGEGDAIEWIHDNPLTSSEFKAAHRELIEIALENDPEIGLDFDPIFDAQDYPDDFIIEGINKEGYVILKGKEWPQFRAIIKMKAAGSHWEVDGAGVINIPEALQLNR
jgi:tetratricopeptide (TPR) repeat protein